MWYFLIPIAIIIIGFLAARAKKLGYFDKKDNAAAGVAAEQVTGKYFPCLLEGSIDMPVMADVIKAARIDVEVAREYLISRGMYRADLSDAECMALCSMPVEGQAGWDGVNTFGGGGPYGGRYLTGSFHFEIDVNGQQIPEKSWITLFSNEHYPVTGGIEQDGTIAMGSIGGVDIRGSVASGKPVGRAMHGSGQIYIYGNLNGGYRKL